MRVADNSRTIVYTYVLLVLASCLSLCYSECMNACSGHGKCTVWDMCICDRNWQSNDCSERTCMFGNAWFDSPKGDLDASGTIEGPNDPVAVNSEVYPYGTSESYPSMQDSDHNDLTQTAHDYAECSNAGICNRNTGLCDCQSGFEGGACQRMSCPSFLDSEGAIEYHAYEGVCSGHGVCQTLRNVAKSDFGTQYKLWDRDMSTACICDAGYFGGDCHMRSCKKELDPMYLDDVTPMQYGRYYFPFLTSASNAIFYDAYSLTNPGKFSVTYYDQYDQGWETSPISINCNCDALIEALEALPNGLIPKGYTACQELTIFELNPMEKRPAWEFRRVSRYTAYRSTNPDYDPRIHTWEVHPTFWIQGFDNSYDTNTTSKTNTATANSADNFLSGKIFSMEFLGNYGERKQPVINRWTDKSSKLPTLAVNSGELFTNIWTDGQRDEGVNHWSNHCAGVTVGVVIEGEYTYLSSFGYGEKLKLKKCLGGSDHDDTNNGDDSTANWDHGTPEFPHMIRLVRTVTDITDSGFYVPLIYDTTTTGKDDSGDFYTNGDAAHTHYDDANFRRRFNDGSGYQPIGTDGTFKLLIPFDGLDHIPFGDTTHNMVQFEVYTTKGVVQRAGKHTEVSFDFASNIIYTTNVTQGTLYNGNIECSSDSNRTPYQVQDNDNYACMNKGDYFFMFDPFHLNYNPPHLNLHKAISMIYDDSEKNRGENEYIGHRPGYPSRFQSTEYITTLSQYKTQMIVSDISTNWAQDVDGVGVFWIYKFFPHKESTYEYVAECSNRGLCNYFEGTCECFNGYTGEACSLQNAMSV